MTLFDVLDTACELVVGIAELTTDFVLDVAEDVLQLGDELLHCDEEGYRSPFARGSEGADDKNFPEDVSSVPDEDQDDAMDEVEEPLHEEWEKAEEKFLQ